VGLGVGMGWGPGAAAVGERTGLVRRFRTAIWRETARVGLAQGSIELALDLGHIHAGRLSVPVCELEIELVDGHPSAVIEAARDWVLRHGLWLDTRTKAHRGDRLARQAAGEAPPAAKRVSAEGDLAHLLEQFTDWMSEVAQDTHNASAAAAWRGSLRHLSAAMPDLADLPGLSALHKELAGHHDAASVARAPSTTLLCLNLFARLIG